LVTGVAAGSRQVAAIPARHQLLPEFRQNGGRNFNTDERDFVAVYSR
jgi:hypothetical protein